MKKVISQTLVLGVLMFPALSDLRAAEEGGTISGVVKFKGTAPAPKKLEVTKDKEACKKPLYDASLVVDKGTGGVHWAVITVTGVKGKFAQELTLDNKSCEFVPRVLAVPAGSTLKVFNSDGVLHNTHLTPTEKKNKGENKALPGFLTKQKKPIMFGPEYFQKPEVVRVTCDAHSWMLGWIVVTDGPAAVTDEKGNFKIANVPPGTYNVEVWHETLGKGSRKVTVKAKEEAKVSFEMAKK